jgi:VIT1/CCC1 family predicted Fe2+/Mn2+ transporter
VWESTSSTFFAKLVFALTFIIPVLLFYNSLGTAMIISIAWGLLGIGILSFIIAKEKKEKMWKVVTEHVGITLVVIVITHFAGDLIAMAFH